MRFGSVCSGIEAASVAWHPLGWQAAWLAEIEPFPCAVLAHHYPTVPNLGDMTTITQRVLAGEVEAPDVFTGGTPCQAFSVAGLRRSLEDARGNLSLTFCEIADAIDAVRLEQGDEPAVIVWENVPGVLSTKDNAFGCFLGALAGEDCELQPPGGKWADAGCVLGPARAVAWRVLDAQYFGLAQRRRRVFVVASARKGFDPAAVLFEFDGVRRDSAPSREPRKDTTGSTGDGVARCVTAGEMKRQDWETCNFVAQPVAFHPTQDPISSTDGTTHAMGCGSSGGTATVAVAFSSKDYGADAANDLAPTLRAMGHAGSHANGGGQVAVAIRIAQTGSNDWGINTEGTAYTLDSAQQAVAVGMETVGTLDARTKGGGFPGTDGAAAGHVVPVAMAFAIQAGALRTNPNSGPDGVGVQADHAYTLEARAEVQAVAVALRGRDGGATAEVGDDCAFTLRASGGGGDKPHAMTGMAVRRLTPRECERLQGFPDDYTAIPWRGKPADQCPDGPRYKALGNSWAVPCAAWIGRRIQQALA